MTALNLSDFICMNVESILEKWDDFARDILSEHTLGAVALRDHAKGMLLEIAADLGRAQTPDEQAEKSKGRGQRSMRESMADLHGVDRAAAGFSIVEAVSEFRALRASVLRLWSEKNAAGLPAGSEGPVRFNEAIDQALAESVTRFSREKERRARLFDTLLSASPELHYIFDLGGRCTYANKSVTDWYGVPLGEIVGKNFFDLGSSGAAEIQQRLDQVIASKLIYRGDVSCTQPSGKEGVYEFILAPVINAEGEVEAVAATARDMTERKRLENDLVREKATADMIIESAPGAFFMIDQQNNLVRWNEFLSKESGLSAAQLRGCSILSCMHDEDRSYAAAKLLTAFATGYSTMEVRVPTREHGVRLYLKTARRLVVDGVPYLAGFCIDVTDRKLSEEALAKEKVFSDAVIESVPGAFYVIDGEGNFYRWNSYLRRLTGLTDRQLDKRPMLMSVQEEDRALAAATMKEAFDNGYAQAELHLLTQERGVRLYFMTARRFQVGDTSYLVGVGTDTTEWLAKMKELEHEAWIDPLTQVANRGHFMEMAKLEFARCRRYGHPLSLWMLDVDHFKAINDTYGHHGGDLALRAVVTTSQSALRDWDLLGRMGGEEFAVLLPETETEQAVLVAERLRQTVATDRIALDDGNSAHVTVSIGIATASEEDTDLETLLERADQALYEAKRTGRDKVSLARRLPAY